MAGGLETRSPFFDVDLVETMLSLAPEYAFGAELSRPLQREAMAGRLPEEIRQRPEKSYFDQLFYRGLGVEDAAAVNRLLTAPDAELRAWVDMDAVRSRLLDPGPKEARGRGAVLAQGGLAARDCGMLAAGAVRSRVRRPAHRARAPEPAQDGLRRAGSDGGVKTQVATGGAFGFAVESLEPIPGLDGGDPGPDAPTRHSHCQ